MSVNTNCESCIFAHPVSEDKQCDLNIIDAIKHNKEIIVKNGYNYINNYMCRLAFSKKTYEDHKDDLSLETIKNNLVTKCAIKYYLIININSINRIDIENICTYLNKLDIKPKMVSFMLSKVKDIVTLVDYIKLSIDTNIQWKVHNFIDDETLDSKLINVVDINKKSNNSHYFLLTEDTDIENINKDILILNDYINIQQDKYHLLLKKNHEINGLFMSFGAYDFLKFHYGKNINDWINESEETKDIIRYTYDI